MGTKTCLQTILDDSLAAGRADPRLMIEQLELPEDVEAAVLAVQALEAMPLERQCELMPALCHLLDYPLARAISMGRLPRRVADSAREAATPVLLRIVQRALAFSERSSADRGGMLAAVKFLAAYGADDGAELVVDLACRGVDSQYPEWADVLEALPPCHLAEACERVGRSMPKGYIGLALFRAAGDARREGETKEHSFNNRQGAGWIEQFLRDGDPVRGTFARDMVAQLHWLDLVYRKPLYELALRHPRLDVRVAAAGAMAGDDDAGLAEQGLKRLIEFCQDVNTSALAVHAMEDLSREGEIPEQALDEAFVARADVCQYLAQDSEKGRPPDAIELLDSRRINWPPTEDRRTLYLFVASYRIGEDGGAAQGGDSAHIRPPKGQAAQPAAGPEGEQGPPTTAEAGLASQSFVALTGGAAVKCFYDQAMTAWPVDDIYAFHCSWEMRFLEDPHAQTGDIAEGLALLGRHGRGEAADDPDADLFDPDLVDDVKPDLFEKPPPLPAGVPPPLPTRADRPSRPPPPPARRWRTRSGGRPSRSIPTTRTRTSSKAGATMTTAEILSIDDPRVAGFRDLKGRTARGEAMFVTEGRTLTRRLLEGRFEVESILVAEQFRAEFEELAGRRGVPAYVADEELMRELVGFPFHQGVLGCAKRGAARPLADLQGLLEREGPVTLVVCPHTANRENLGSVFRSSGAFGVDAVLLGSGCCDVFSRRCLRCSMGAVLSLPVIQPADLAADLRELRTRWGFELWGAVLDERAQVLSRLARPPRVALLLGNEFEGLGEEWLALCDRRVTVPMHGRIDSLNVAVAAGVFLYELCGR